MGAPIAETDVGLTSTRTSGTVVSDGAEARSLGGDEVLITHGDVYLKQVEGRVYRRE